MCRPAVLSCGRPHARWDNHGFIHGGNYDQPPSIRTSRRADRAGVHDLAGRWRSRPRRPARPPLRPAGPSPWRSRPPPRVSRPATPSSGTAPTSATRTGPPSRDRHPEPGGEDDQQHLGQVHRRRGGAARQDLHDHLVLQRLGCPRRAGRGCEARHHRADHRRRGDQQAGELQALEVPEAAINRLKRGNFSNPDPNNIARECSGSCRGGAGTPHSKFFLFDDVGSSPRPQHRDADLDEPDPVRLQGPVEPGHRVQGREALQPVPADPQPDVGEAEPRRRRVRAPGRRGRDQHLLSRGQCLA